MTPDERLSRESSIADVVKTFVKGGEGFIKDIDGFISKSRTKNNVKNVEPEMPNESLKDEFKQLEYLEKLGELKDKGIISEEEFQKKKEDNTQTIKIR